MLESSSEPTLKTPVALTIAGFDTSAGAGLQADLLTFHNHRYHTVTATTALVVETPLKVALVEPVKVQTLQKQIQLLLATYPIAVIKIGLLASPAQAECLAPILAKETVPIVLDPVGISSTGTALQEPGTGQAIAEKLAPLLSLITPNFPEALALLGPSAPQEPAELARELAQVIDAPVLLTGGHHGNGREFTDILVENGQLTPLSAPLIASAASLHGTGCVLSSAIAAGLGAGQSLPDAVANGRQYLRQTMAKHLSFRHSAPLLALNHQQSQTHFE